MKVKRVAVLVGAGSMVLVVLMLFVASALAVIPAAFSRLQAGGENQSGIVDAVETRGSTPGILLPSLRGLALAATSSEPDSLAALYEQVTHGIVSIQVVSQRAGSIGQGAGSGFILDDSGRIVTNNHVVAGADRITVIFFNGTEAEAKILGTDDDSDLAVIEVEELPDGIYPLPLGDSNRAKVGQWVVAIGNPFGLSGSMTLGIVSAVGRTIPSGATTFSIPEAIQTDAAINPGNSGGPLLNLQGEVIGVNAQIRTNGEQANAGVGFAIPSNTVQLVAPVLIRRQSYQWPWVGVQGANVTLLIMEANDLETQQGAYIDRVIASSPAEEGGLRGTSGTRSIDGLPIPVGGDVVVEVDGNPVVDFADLLVRVAFRSPGDMLELTIIRDGQRRQVDVTLVTRPDSIDQ